MGAARNAPSRRLPQGCGNGSKRVFARDPEGDPKSQSSQWVIETHILGWATSWVDRKGVEKTV
jgi:hypothetical protein